MNEPMTNTDSVGPEPKAERESQPTSALKRDLMMTQKSLADMAKKMGDAQRTIRRYEESERLRAITNSANKSAAGMTDEQIIDQTMHLLGIECSLPTGEMLRRLRSWGGTTNETGKVPSPEAAAIPQAPQRGEVGAGSYLNGFAYRIESALNGAQEARTFVTREDLKELRAALSRPPVVRAMTAKENDLIEWMLKINEFNGAPIMWLSRLEHLAGEVAAERALAVPPESEVG